MNEQQTSEKVLFTAKSHTQGGREGNSQSGDGSLDIILAPPGNHRGGTNPEQLFAAGWSACFISALGLVARKQKVALPAETYVDAEVDLKMDDKGYFLEARLNISLPGFEVEVAEELVELAHQNCPYSKATKGNIKVTTNIL